MRQREQVRGLATFRGALSVVRRKLPARGLAASVGTAIPGKRLAALLGAAALSIAFVAPVAAATQPATGRFAFVDDFIDTSCGFPIHLVEQVTGTFQIFFDAQGNVTKVMVQKHWTGTDTDLDNGKSLSENGALSVTDDFVNGSAVTETDAGQIHGLIPNGVQDAHDRGLIVFDLENGTILVEHGQFPGANSGGTAACAAFL